VGALELFDLSGKTAVVVGGSRGIGLAIAEGLASVGARVVIANRQAALGLAAAETLRAKGLTAISRAVDVTQRQAVERLVAETQAEFGGLDILVNSAAIILRKPIEEVTDEEWQNLMDVNLRGAFVCCQVAGRKMLEQKRGKIINIASNVAQVLQPLRGVYAVSKAGLAHLTRVLALEWASRGVQVNAIAPAPTITDINRGYFETHPQDLQDRLRSIPLGRLGDPRDYVGMALLLASRASDFITGQTIFVDGGSNLI